MLIFLDSEDRAPARAEQPRHFVRLAVDGTAVLSSDTLGRHRLPEGGPDCASRYLSSESSSEVRPRRRGDLAFRSGILSIRRRSVDLLGRGG